MPSVTAVVDPLRPASRRQVQLRPHRRPQAPILLRSQAERDQVRAGFQRAIDVHYLLAAGHGRPQGAGRQISPARRVEEHPSLAGAEPEPARASRRIGEVALWKVWPPVQPLRHRRHDDIDVDAVAAQVYGGALLRLLPVAVDGQQRPDQCRREVQRRDREHG
jgi:hypothetical protein